MKIEVPDNIPVRVIEEFFRVLKEYPERDIFIFGGIECLIRKFKVREEWEVRVQECGRCGKCCAIMTGRSFPFSSDIGCVYLEESGNEKLCGLGYYRPNGCAVAEANVDDCKVVWEPIK